MTDTGNPRAIMGGNLSNDAPDFARLEVERLEQDYAQVANTAADLITEADALPEEIADVDQKGKFADLIKRIRDTAARAEALRVVEGEPHYRRKQGVDQFFFGIIDRLARRDRKNREGAADTLLGRLTAYDTKMLREEQERRRVEAERLAAEARKAEETRLAALAAAEDARLAAERARKPETIAVKQEAALAAEATASEARIETEIKAQAAEDAYVATLAKPADLMRTRTAGGTLSTVAREYYAEIEDENLLDALKLWAHVPTDDKTKALRRWAKLTNHREQMAGAKIGSRPKSSVR